MRSNQHLQVPRHKTAIRRTDGSAPIKRALEDGVVQPGLTVFDYGCGHGQDLQFLSSHQIESSGWDPVFRPNFPPRQADIVNLGYVINVIEDPSERTETLRRAWELCRKTLIVSAQILVPGRGNQQIEFGDGIITRRQTFQKFFAQGELRDYIASVTGTDPVPAAIGIYYVFKDDEARELFVAGRYRRRTTAPRKKLSELRFEEHKDLLQALINCGEALGRLPERDEFELADQVISTFGSMKSALALIRRVAGADVWAESARERRDDLLVYLALARFRRRPQVRQLPLTLQRDIRTFFGSYSQACAEADELLFRAGDSETVDRDCCESAIGKLLPNALYVHRSAVEMLAPLLRVYEGCGRAFLGELEGVNVIKIHRFSGKISYLEYRDFEADPHPALVRSYKLAMRTQELDCFDYGQSENPPILHRKETFLLPQDSRYAKFAKLTKQEENHGLLDDSRVIGTKQAWQERLRKAGFTIRGHRLIRMKGNAENAAAE